jgi:predicted porin
MRRLRWTGLVIGSTVSAANANSSVTLDGVADVGVAYQMHEARRDASIFNNPKGTYNQLTMASGQSAASRWGIKVIEDLGDGYQANFVHESAVNLTDGASTGFTRQATLGLSNAGLGSIDLGRSLSKRTNLYTYYSYMDAPDMQSGASSKIVGAGIKHVF